MVYLLTDVSVADTDNWHKLNASTNAFVRLPFTVNSPGIQIGLTGTNVPETELELCCTCVHYH